MESRTRIFGKFAQADGGNTRQRSGTRPGCRSAGCWWKSTGGQIDLDSTVGEGTTFHVVLPLASPS
jgi:signal transduction histidine kinase